jgi:hypothetical protein
MKKVVFEHNLRGNESLGCGTAPYLKAWGQVCFQSFSKLREVKLMQVLH